MKRTRSSLSYISKVSPATYLVRYADSFMKAMRIEAKQKFLLAIAASLFVAINACSLTKGRSIAEQAVFKFHDMYNTEQYQDIYDQTDDAFKKSTKQEDFLAILQAMQRKLGMVKESTPITWYVNATTLGTIVTLTYDTEFTEGHAKEQFVFRVSGDQAKLYGYYINSPLLITK